MRYSLGRQFGATHGKLNTMDRQFRTPQLFRDHIPARSMQKLLGHKIWSDIFTFSMVRNPYDRVLSLYHYRRRVGMLQEMTFKDFVLALARATKHDPLFKYHGFRFGAADYLTDEQGVIMVDYVGKYENRTNDLKTIAARIGAIDLGSTKIQQASDVESHYMEMYDLEMRERVFEKYRLDFELFGYDY